MSEERENAEDTNGSFENTDPKEACGIEDQQQESDNPPFTKLFSLDQGKSNDAEIIKIINSQFQYNLTNSKLCEDYNVLFLFSSGPITRWDANRIYTSVVDADREKPILLILSSPGGDIAAAYFIAKLCREYTNLTFEAAVPRHAKSAATLICCGSDRIHMGSLSELGPIDPQFNGVPALALKHSVEHIAQLVKECPESTELFSEYLSKSLKIESIGYYERVAKSATDYAIRLLGLRKDSKKEPSSLKQIASRLVYDYTDHGFVIDINEATDIFGESIVAHNTNEYKSANSLYQDFDIMEWVCLYRFKKEMSFVGDIKRGCVLLHKGDS